MTFNIHPKQITEHSNVNKRYRGLINVPGNPFLYWIFEASNSLFPLSWVLCSQILLKWSWKKTPHSLYSSSNISSLPPFFPCISDLPLQWSLLQPHFLPPFWPPLLQPFFLLQPLFLSNPSAATKSEVDSLWPLRMRHVARWDSDTWLNMGSAETNSEKVTHA